jgi:alkylation response protein AidB-like acyl-CoA dehydrogenase
MMQSDEREMLRASLRRLLGETDAAKVPAALDEFGWLDLLVGDPGEAVAALFETQGETATASPALNAVMARPLLAAAPGLDRTAPAGVGEWSVVVPGPGTGAGGTASVYAVAAGAPIGRCLVATQQEGQHVLAVVVPAEETRPGQGIVRPVEGIDPGLGLVRFDAGGGDARVEIVARGPVVSAAWEESVAAGRRALAHELCGLGRAMLALAVDHAGERRQFGRPIGEFQAVKHRLADAKVALTSAEAAAGEAWADPDVLTALLAKLWAGRAARVAGKQAQQVLGGMGFTWEHPFHRYLRRALVLDSLLGSATELQAELGRMLLTTGEVPLLARL